MSFELLMNGVGNAFSLEHWGTSFLVRRDGFCLAVDAPDSYRRALRANGFEADGEPLDVGEIDAMFVTHLHGDHVNGLEMTLAYRRYVTGEPMEIFGPPPVATDLWERRLGVSLGQTWDGSNFQSLGPEDYYQFRQIPWDASAQIGPFEVEIRQTIHHLPAAAMRISDGEATVGYSCDTAFDESLVEWLADADLILHETSPGPGHTSLEKLRGVSGEVREKLKVVHLPDELLDLEAEVELEFAAEGAVYAVGE